MAALSTEGADGCAGRSGRRCDDRERRDGGFGVSGLGQGLCLHRGFGLGGTQLQIGFEARQKRGLRRAAQSVGVAHRGGPLVRQLTVHGVGDLRSGLRGRQTPQQRGLHGLGQLLGAALLVKLQGQVANKVALSLGLFSVGHGGVHQDGQKRLLGLCVDHVVWIHVA